MDILSIEILKNFTFSLKIEIGTLFIIAFVFYAFWKVFCNKSKRLTVNEVSLGIGCNIVKLKYNNDIQKIAYKLWVELNTRKIGMPIDADNDVISEVYDSWYVFFCIARNLMKDIPITKFNECNELIRISSEVLNNGLRPHLTKWQARYRKWYNVALVNEYGTPQEIQKRYPYYEELMRDLIITNKNMINYKELMRRIAFGEDDTDSCVARQKGTEIFNGFQYIKRIFSYYINKYIALFGILMCLICFLLNYFFLENIAGSYRYVCFSNVKDLAALLTGVNASILVYYSVIPKINIDILVKKLSEIQYLKKKNILKAKALYDDYNREYFKIQTKQRLLNIVKLVNYVAMLLLVIVLHIWMYTEKINLILSFALSGTIVYIIVAIGYTTDTVFIYELSPYPKPNDLLNIKKTFPKIRDLSVKFDENIQLALLKAGLEVSIFSHNQEQIKHETDVRKLSFCKKINAHIHMSCAVPFDFEDAVLEILKDGIVICEITLSQKKYHYRKINPCLEIMLLQENLSGNINFKLKFKDDQGRLILIGFKKSGSMYIVSSICTSIDDYLFSPLKDDECIVIGKSN